MSKELEVLLKAINENLNKIAGKSPIYIGATLSNRSIKTIVIREDTVFSEITGSKGTNYLTRWGISGRTLVKGEILSADFNDAVKSITTGTGSAMGYE